MRAESTTRPELVERYKTLTRINFGVSETVRNVADVQMTIFEYFSVELRTQVTYDELVARLIAEKYSITDQITILANTDSFKLNEFLEWGRVCKNVAKTVLGIAETLEDVKEEKLHALSAHDKSNNVNLAYVNGMSVWFDALERIKIRNGIDSVMVTGQNTYDVNFNGMFVTLDCEAALSFFSKLEVYAVQCFNVTETHKHNILKLETIEKVKAYDFTTGYPEKINEVISI